jgi:hypothetical protein
LGGLRVFLLVPQQQDNQAAQVVIYNLPLQVFLVLVVPMETGR